MKGTYETWFSVAELAKVLGIRRSAVYRIFRRIKDDWKGHYRKIKGRLLFHPDMADAIAQYTARWERPKGRKWKTPKQLEHLPGVTRPRIYVWAKKGLVRHRFAGRRLYVHADDVERIGREFEDLDLPGYAPLQALAPRLGVSVTWLKEAVTKYGSGLRYGRRGQAKVTFVNVMEAERLIRERYRRLTPEEQHRYALSKAVLTRKLAALDAAKDPAKRAKIEADIRKLKAEIKRLEAKKGGGSLQEV